MKNQKFNMRRFGNLLSYDLRSHYKTHLGFLVLLAGTIILAALFKDLNNTITRFSVSVFCLSGCFGPTVFTSRIFRNMFHKNGSIDYLMLPASNLEKFLVRFVNQVVMPLVVVSVMNFVFVLVMMDFDSFSFVDIETVSEMPSKLAVIAISTITLLGYTICINFTVFGSTILRRYTFFITQLLIVVALAIIGYVSSAVLDDQFFYAFIEHKLLSDGVTMMSYLTPRFYVIVAAELFLSISLLVAAYKTFCHKTV